MADGTLQTFEDGEKLIGGAILRFGQIEGLIDAVICVEYTPGDSRLQYEMLADEGFSFALRCNVLRKILERHGWFDKEAKTQLQRLRELGNMRNVFAHLGRLAIVQGKAGLMHSKDPNDVINDTDLEAKRKEFDAGCEAAFPFLLKIATTISPYQRALREQAARDAEAKKAEAPQPAEQKTEKKEGS